jgi:hypothetical protein
MQRRLEGSFAAGEKALEHLKLKLEHLVINT